MYTTGPGTVPRPIRRALSGLAAVALLAIAVPVLAETTPTDPEPDLQCPSEYGTGVLTHYETTVNTPADSTDWYVSVTFTLAGNADCELTLATYDLPERKVIFPQHLYDADTGTFGPGKHTLTAALPLEEEYPGCWAQYDFVFGPPIQTLTADDPYDGSIQIRARLTGAAVCGVNPTPTPSPTPSESQQGGTPTPVPTPVVTPTPTESEGGATPTPEPTREGELGGTPTPTPGGGELPDTRTPTGTDHSLALAAVLLAAGALYARRLAVVRAADRRR